MQHDEIRKRSLTRSAWISLLCAALLLVAGVGSVFAYVIIDGSNQADAKQVVVTFTPGAVTCTVDSTTGAVTNTGNSKAYIRAALILNWVNSGGEIYYDGTAMPAPTFTLGENWFKVGDYYYYKEPVAVNNATQVLINNTAELTNSSTEYTLRYTIVAEAIQAEGTGENSVPAIQDAWGTGITRNDDGTLKAA